MLTCAHSGDVITFEGTWKATCHQRIRFIPTLVLRAHPKWSAAKPGARMKAWVISGPLQPPLIGIVAARVGFAAQERVLLQGQSQKQIKIK